MELTMSIKITTSQLFINIFALKKTNSFGELWKILHKFFTCEVIFEQSAKPKNMLRERAQFEKSMAILCVSFVNFHDSEPQ